MKKIGYSIAFMAILCVASLTIHGQNPSLVLGENLNIGRFNTLTPSGLMLLGNAIGISNTLMSGHTLAVGQSDTISENSDYSVALGSYNYLNGLSSMAFGSFLRVNGDHGVAIGSGIVGNRGVPGGTEVHVPLSNNTANSLMVGFNSTKPTLFVSESPNDFDLEILDRTGRVAIGDVTPLAKLHIHSDSGEDAGILLQPSLPRENIAFVRFMDTIHQIIVDTVGDMLVSAGNYHSLEFNSSNFNVKNNTASIGSSANIRLYLSSKTTPSVSVNAKPVSTGYERGTSGPSYAMEFGDNAFMLRTATYMEPRGHLINNWMTPVTVTTKGAITLIGNVGINTENTTADYALAVDGGILTTKVHILNVADWQDCVFGEDYQLMPLKDVEAYVATHRHLPGIPSEAEVKADGFDMAEMQAALLGKIEELVLHAIRQQKEIDSLRNLVRVNFGYDACGNRVSRTLEFSKADSGRGITADNGPMAGLAQWQASITDCFAGVETMLFPNPTEGGFFLTFNGDELPKGVTALLCAVDGTVLEERTVKGTNEEFDLGKRAVGVYLLRLVLGDTVKTWKVIKRN